MRAHHLLVGIALVASLLIGFDTLFESNSGTENIATFWNTGHWGGRNHSASANTKLDALYVKLPIDHEDQTAGSFFNRYWVYSEFYKPGGPVFVHDVGEKDAESSATRHLTRSPSYLLQLLQGFHGIGIVWEHRYYGQSLPFPVNQSTPLEHFRLLNLNQSLADLPYFARNFSDLSWPNADLTPSSTPWIMIGCSYAGLRSATSRLFYPETFFAAYSGSAPVQLRANFDKFFDPIHQKMLDQGYGECANDLHVITSYIDTQLAFPDTAAEVKKLLLGPGAEENDNGDFTLAIANIYSYFQTGGIAGGRHSLASLCEYLKQDTYPDIQHGSNDPTFQYRAASLTSRLSSWPGLRAIVNNHFSTNCGEVTNANVSTRCNLGQTDSNSESIAWTWQLCSELGLFATQRPNVQALVSTYQSIEYRKSLCTRQFPSGRGDGFLPELPLVEAINNETGGRSMRPSNVFWTAGEYDPWRSLTPLAATSGSIPPNHQESFKVSISQKVSKCDVSTGQDTVFGYILKDAQHCLDYSTRSEEARIAQTFFKKALREWLPCFQPVQSGS